MMRLWIKSLLVGSAIVLFIFISPLQAQIPFDFYPNINSPTPKDNPQPREEDLNRYRVPPPPYPNYYVTPYTYWHPDIANPNIAKPNIANPHVPTQNIANPNPIKPNLSYEGMQYMDLR